MATFAPSSWLIITTAIVTAPTSAEGPKITILHDFKDSIHAIINATFALTDLGDTRPTIKEMNMNKNQDVTGSIIFNIGSTIGAENTSAVIGPPSSSGVFLLHPHMVISNVPHVSPVAEDPVFEATDRFPRILRMNKGYHCQLRAIVDLLRKMSWSTLAIISSESDYNRHASEDLRKYGESIGITISLNRHLNDLTGEITIRDHLSDIRRAGNRVVLLLCDHMLASAVLAEASAANMTAAGWAWILWNDVADQLIVQNTDTPSRQSRLFPNGSNELITLPDVPGLLAVRTSFVGGPLLEEFNNEFSRFLGGNFTILPNINQLKYADALLATMYGLSICRGNDTGQSLFNCILKVRNKPGITRNLTFDEGKRETIYDTRYEILNSKSGRRWSSVGMWQAGELGSNDSLELHRDQLLLPGGLRSIPSYQTRLEFQVLEIITIVSEPFVKITSSNKIVGGSVSDGNGKYFSGFCIELLEELKKTLRFKYNIRDLGPDAKFGSRNPVSGYWDGLIGELMYGSVDLIVAPLTVTEERLKYIDLTSPFMESELKFAINRHAVTGYESAYFKYSFLLPFSEGLWVALFVSIIVMALYLTLISRLSPYGAHGRYYQSAEGAESCAKLARKRKSSVHLLAMERRRCSMAVIPSGNDELKQNVSDDEHSKQTEQKDSISDSARGEKLVRTIMKKRSSITSPDSKPKRSATTSWKESDAGDSDSDEEEGRNARRFMSINNALYFACAGLMWQSPECVPRAPSARVVAGIWYMVGVIIVASYTANLVAFVTYQSTSNHLDSLEALLDQRLISPGTISSSSVEDLLMTSNLDMAGKLYKEILRKPDTSLQSSFSSAWDLTMKGELALVWDGAYLDHASMQDGCKTSTIPVGFGRPTYGFALRRGSLFTEIFNRQLLELRQSGVIQELTDRYFGSTCENYRTEESSNEQDRLTFSSLSGVFIMLGAAAAGSLVVLAVEWFVACWMDLQVVDIENRRGFFDALRERLDRLSVDAKENWMPLSLIVNRRPTATQN